MERPRVFLSRNERLMLRGLTAGKRNREIAKELHLAEQTINGYMSLLYSKLGLHSRKDAAMWALAHAELL